MKRLLSLRTAVLFGLIGGMQALSAGAQSSLSLSGPIGENLTETSSDIAPTSSTELFSGSSNLLAPDGRTPLYDATKSNIFATTMNPQVITSNVIGRNATQLDSSVKDVIRFTISPLPLQSGKADQASINASFRGASSLPLATSSSSSWGKANSNLLSAPSQESQPSDSAKKSQTLNSSWTVGKNSKVLSVASVRDTSTQPVNDSDQANTPETFRVAGEDGPKATSLENQPTPGTLKSFKQKSSSASNRHEQEQDVSDSSTSPLERVEPSLQQSAEAARTDATPFKDLNTSNFLEPNIFIRTKAPVPSISASFARENRRSASNASDLTSNGLGSNDLRTNRRRSGLRRQAKTTDLEDPASQLKKTESGSERRLQNVQRPKWHNPLLQQMEENQTLQ